MDNVIAARALMGISLSFHIIYATIGIGLPLMLMLAEGLSLRTGDELYHRMARRWTRPAGLLFAIGAVSGRILSFELGFLWPRFMEQGGPLIGGWPDPETREVRYGIEIPGLLSLFAFRDLDAVVTGLDAFAPEEIPDPRLVHPFFDLMVASFFFMTAVAAWFWWRRWRAGEVPTDRRLLWSVVLAAPFGMIALESGWLFTEFGRQPWIVHGVMRVESGVTPNAGMGAVFLTFIVTYAVLTAGLLQMLLRQPESGQEGDSGEARHDYP